MRILGYSVLVETKFPMMQSLLILSDNLFIENRNDITIECLRSDLTGYRAGFQHGRYKNIGVQKNQSSVFFAYFLCFCLYGYKESCNCTRNSTAAIPAVITSEIAWDRITPS